MTANKDDISRASADIGSDLAKVDAYENTSADYEEIPDMGDMDMDEVLSSAAKPARGRPPLGDKAKQSVLIRLDPDVIAAFKAGGAGWQTRMNDVLARQAARLRKSAKAG